MWISKEKWNDVQFRLAKLEQEKKYWFRLNPLVPISKQEKDTYTVFCEIEANLISLEKIVFPMYGAGNHEHSGPIGGKCKFCAKSLKLCAGKSK